VFEIDLKKIFICSKNLATGAAELGTFEPLPAALESGFVMRGLAMTPR